MSPDDLSRRLLLGSVAVARFPQRFAEAVKVKRHEYSLTQEQLALAVQQCGLQITQGYISLLEAGQRTDPDVRLVAAVAALLGISLDKLLEQDEP